MTGNRPSMCRVAELVAHYAATEPRWTTDQCKTQALIDAQYESDEREAIQLENQK